MMKKKAIWLESDRFSQWDEFVTRNPLGTIYHLSGWKNSIEQSFQHIKGYFLVIVNQETGDILSGLPLYTISSKFLGNRIVGAPFSTFCNPLISSVEDLKLLMPLVFQLYEKSLSRTIELSTCNASESI
jgi:hypothetical protein